MKQLIVRFLSIGLAAFVIGVGGNHWKKQGFRWKYIIHTLADDLTYHASSSAVPADSAFAAFLNESATFIDIRSKLDYDIDHIPGAVLFPYESFICDPEQLNKRINNDFCVIYGDKTMTQKAYHVVRQLKRGGVHHAVILENGYGAWLDMDFPIESKGE